MGLEDSSAWGWEKSYLREGVNKVERKKVGRGTILGSPQHLKWEKRKMYQKAEKKGTLAKKGHQLRTVLLKLR